MSDFGNALCNLDDLQFHLSCVVDMVCAVHKYIEDDDCETKSYANALFGCYLYLDRLSKEIRTEIDTLYQCRIGESSTESVQKGAQQK